MKDEKETTKEESAQEVPKHQEMRDMVHDMMGKMGMVRDGLDNILMKKAKMRAGGFGRTRAKKPKGMRGM